MWNMLEYICRAWAVRMQLLIASLVGRGCYKELAANDQELIPSYGDPVSRTVAKGLQMSTISRLYFGSQWRHAPAMPWRTCSLASIAPINTTFKIIHLIKLPSDRCACLDLRPVALAELGKLCTVII